MSAYDDAVAYLDAEVHPRCDYDLYSGMRDIVDEMEAENERLKRKLEILKAHGVEIVDAVADGFEVYSEDYRRADALKGENKKLRELVRDLHKALFMLDIDHCQACPRDNINGPCAKFMVRGSEECSIEEDMRELGIEVDE